MVLTPELKEKGKAMDKLWWEKPMRVIQYNLQVADTQKMQPEKIARELKEDYANAAVINVGGIYAWYQSGVPFHHINEFLPPGRDLLQELLDSCHARGIRVIARFDFSKTDDLTYLHHPEWFAKRADGTPFFNGKDRMGLWSLLLSTCINGGYRNEEVAVPVMEEVLERYDIDGIFFNAPFGSDCFCERCRKKYKETYGEEMPEDPDRWADDWQSRCLKDNIEKINRAVKALRPDIPVILYYHAFDFGLDINEVDDLDARYATADMICTEAQDVLSRGAGKVPPAWKPMVNMKIGNAVPGYPRPFGIIHSCPGMDWRHTGLPESEYMFWMAQVMACNAHIWHSVTGFNDTITDKRLLSCVREINRRTALCEGAMAEAESSAQVLLLWDGSYSASGWVEGMCAMQYQFDLMDLLHIDPKRMSAYPVVVMADGFPTDDALAAVLEDYVRRGGHLIVEQSGGSGSDALHCLQGLEADRTESVELRASYLRFETEQKTLHKGMEDTLYVPLRGRVLYRKPMPDTQVLMTLVPPFAPMDGVGNPPERASLPVKRTDIPMLTVHNCGEGAVMTLAFSLSRLLLEVHLEDHYLLMRNCLDTLCGQKKEFEIADNVAGLLACVYHAGENRILVHLINGIGQRPLVGRLPYHDLKFRIRLPKGRKIRSVSPVIEEEAVSFEQTDTAVTVTLDKLTVWNMLEIDMADGH